MAVRSLIGVVVLATALAGCGGSAVERGSYVRSNVVLLNTVPVFPGASLRTVSSSPYKGTEFAGADTIGYGTTRTFALRRSASPKNVIAFYRRALLGRWQLVATSAGQYGSWRNGDAYLHILAGPRRLLVVVDHDCYKGGPSPRCFGP